jgi:hypothetical protein
MASVIAGHRPTGGRAADVNSSDGAALRLFAQ